MCPPPSATMPCVGEMGAQALHQLLARPVGLRHQVEITFEFEGDAALEVVRQQRARLARNIDSRLQIPHALRLFRQVFDVVLEDEKVGLTSAGQADEGLVVILDRADHFLAIGQLHADRFGILNQLFEIFRLFKRLFRRARGFSLWWRSASPNASFSALCRGKP